MKKADLKRLISEIVRRKLSEQDASTDVASDTTSVEQKPPVDPKKQKDLENLQKQQAQLTDKIRTVDGRIAKLKEPIERAEVSLTRQKNINAKKLGVITKKISDLQEEP